MTDEGFVAVDWGTTRLRASLIDGQGRVIDRTTSAAGVQSVPPGGFASALEAACAPWFAARPALPVLMAGMVGSRNGWIEAPYVRLPCGPDALAASLARVEGAGRDIRIVPGVDIRWPDGAYDVIRGEETQAIGAGLSDGLVCLPGTHSKWIELAGGSIQRFATFITGELYAAVTGSFVARLAEEPEQPEPAASAGAQAGRLAGGLSRALFQARTRVLAGDMSGHGVRPFLAAMLVESEIAGALELFGHVRRVQLVAGEPQLGVYRAGLAARGIAVTVADPADAVIAGLTRLAHADRGRLGRLK